MIGSNKDDSINQLIRTIATQILDSGLTTVDLVRKEDRQYIKNMRSIIVYTALNFSNKDLNIADLAKMSGYSVAYFTKAFKAYMGETPIMYLNKLRISEAKSLFRDNKLNLNQIASLCGYKNLSTFTEAFKRITGVSPKKYRMKYYN